MGSPPDEARIFNDEGPQHLVSLKGFWISQSAITHAQWCQVMDSNSCSGYSGDRADRGRRPVEKVDWRDARAFCRRLGERTGRIYTLPSEAQWEYACRAGTTTPFYCGSTLISSLANFNASNPYGGAPKGGYRAQTTPVNQFPVNPWGLHDMHGNVSEWCLDIWRSGYAKASADGNALTQGVDDPFFRLLRGGSWTNFPMKCRSAYRDYDLPDIANSHIGFRVVCKPVS
jgi:formylglycine-generating enzyme required for sulfatase activity